MYLRLLDERADQERIASDELAVLAGVNAAKIRKDLSYLGTYGTRGVGYVVDQLRFEIRRALGMTREWKLAIIGAGNLGSALANYAGAHGEGYRVEGIFDADPAKVGNRIGDVEVEPIRRLGRAVRERGVDIGVIAVPAAAAQEVADTLAGAGVRAILNFAPTPVQVPEGVEIRRLDLSTELRVLGYHLHLAEN
jgi:redox-sensing transcriptional repressor